MSSNHANSLYSIVSLVHDLPALLSCSVLAIHVELGDVGVSVILAVGLDVLHHLGQAKQVVHSLQRQTLGLRNKEPDEDEHGEAEGSIYEECPELD
jgi:hypothetical protein